MSLSNKAPHRRRKRFLVEKDFQYRFTLKLCLISGLLFALFTGISLFFIKLSYEMLIQSALIQMPEMVGKLRWEFRSLSMAMFVNWALFMGAIFVMGVIYTQRIAGPIHALKHKLQDLTGNLKLQKLKFRNNDEFRSLETSYNQAIEALESHLGQVEASARRARDHLSNQAPREALDELNLLIENRFS
jgi:methyl-accepting chemotaxis protein